MTSWPSEQEAIRNMIRKFGGPNNVRSHSSFDSL